MKNHFLFLLIMAVGFGSCQKSIDSTAKEVAIIPVEPVSKTVMYTIKQGQQFCDKNSYTPVNISELKFKVKFDSSAIYTTINSANQGDINKLYGFSNNNAQHHQFSARFGWRWYNSSLEIFAYIYNNGVVTYQKVGNAIIGITAEYSIKVQTKTYQFTLGNNIVIMPRASSTSTGLGYKLFPYFGGDELAPHDVKILIEDL
jgi:hypothetical protein